MAESWKIDGGPLSYINEKQLERKSDCLPSRKLKHVITAEMKMLADFRNERRQQHYNFSRTPASQRFKPACENSIS
jgi:hypothetical protein